MAIPVWQRASVEFKRQALLDRIRACDEQIAVAQGKRDRAVAKVQQLDRELAEADDHSGGDRGDVLQG